MLPLETLSFCSDFSCVSSLSIELLDSLFSNLFGGLLKSLLDSDIATSLLFSGSSSRVSLRHDTSLKEVNREKSSYLSTIQTP